MQNNFLQKIGDVPVCLGKRENKGQDVMVFGLYEDGDQEKEFEGSIGKQGGLEKLGEAGAVQVHYLEGKDAPHISVGLGKTKDWQEGLKDASDYDLLERIRDVVGKAYTTAQGLGGEVNLNIGRFALDNNIFDRGTMIATMTEAAVRAGYQGMRMFSTDREGDSKVTGINLLSHERNWDGLGDAFDYALKGAQAENLARFVMEAPHNYMSPNRVRDTIEGVVESHRNYGLLTLNEKTSAGKEKLQRMGEKGNNPYTALAAVAQASPEAHLIKVEYRGNPDTKDKLAIIGKGVTFDTGGISLKPGAGMREMNGDKGGAGTVIGIMDAVAGLQIPINIDFYVGTTENNPGRDAYKPGSTFYLGDDAEGKPFPAIEIENTDAEGRVVMATPIALAGRNKNVKAIMDYSTLTGAMVDALANHAYGITGNKHNEIAGMMIDALLDAGEQTGERLLHFPAYRELASRITKASKYKGIANSGGPRWGSHFDGYSFLNAFTSGKPFVHVDMAGVLEKIRERSYSTSVFDVPPVLASVDALEAIAKKM